MKKIEVWKLGILLYRKEIFNMVTWHLIIFLKVKNRLFEFIPFQFFNFFDCKGDSIFKSKNIGRLKSNVAF